jgi:hypothetical protein
LETAEGPAAGRAKSPEEAFRRFSNAAHAGKFADALPYIAEPGDAVWKAHAEALKGYETYAAALEKQFGKAKAGEVDIAPGTSKDELGDLAGTAAQTKGTIHSPMPLGKDRVRLTLWDKRPAPGSKKDLAIYETYLDAVQTAKGWKLEVGLPSGGGGPIVKKVRRKDEGGKEIEVYVGTTPGSNEPILPLPYREMADEMRQMKDYGETLAKTFRSEAEAVSGGRYNTRAEAVKALMKMLKRLGKP